jgi:hypothetical protein
MVDLCWRRSVLRSSGLLGSWPVERRGAPLPATRDAHRSPATTNATRLLAPVADVGAQLPPRPCGQRRAGTTACSAQTRRPPQHETRERRGAGAFPRSAFLDSERRGRDGGPILSANGKLDRDFWLLDFRDFRRHAPRVFSDNSLMLVWHRCCVAVGDGTSLVAALSGLCDTSHPDDLLCFQPPFARPRTLSRPRATRARSGVVRFPSGLSVRSHSSHWPCGPSPRTALRKPARRESSWRVIPRGTDPWLQTIYLSSKLAPRSRSARRRRLGDWVVVKRATEWFSAFAENQTREERSCEDSWDSCCLPSC